MIDCDPEDCVVFEDSIFGITAAKKANMKCIAISSGFYSPKELTKYNPDLLVTSIEKKKEILDFIFKT